MDKRQQSMGPATPAGSSRAVTLSVLSHCFALLLIAIPVIGLHSGISPFARLFFCDDESIMYPIKGNTVPFYVAVGVGAAVAIVTVLVVEAISLAAGQDGTKGVISPGLEQCMSTRSAGFLIGILTGLYMVLFGALCTELVTQTGKLGFGRHRPYFLSACLLNATCVAGKPYSIDACSTLVTDEARLSFPSGHSSFCMFIATFLALYMQARLAFPHQMHSLKNACQVALLLLGGYVCMSRVSDYHHHWSDILVGALIGVLFGVLMSFKLAAGLSIFRQPMFPPGLAGCYEMVNSGTVEPKSGRLDSP